MVGLGEIGLDYTIGRGDKGRQQNALLHLLPLAIKHSLPVVIHVRDRDSSTQASSDCLSLFQQSLSRDHPIHRHCFLASAEEAKQRQQAFPSTLFGFARAILSGGYHVELPMVVRNLPLTSIMLETDSLYLLPPSLQGDTTRTNPEMVGELAKQIAGEISPPPYFISQETTATACKFCNFYD